MPRARAAAPQVTGNRYSSVTPVFSAVTVSSWEISSLLEVALHQLVRDLRHLVHQLAHLLRALGQVVRDRDLGAVVAAVAVVA